jgi:hypothetical protein
MIALRGRRWRLLAGLLFAVALLVPAPAGAVTPTRKKAIWGPIVRDGVSQFPIYRDLGVGVFETNLVWADVARTRPAHPRDPADPAYVWPAQLDTAAIEGARYGIRICLQISRTPSWANGGRSTRWAPSAPGDLADFAAAASRRYPTVRLWMIWGEPTKPKNFQPLRSDHGRPLSGKGLRGPHTYARMLDASYAALKSVSRKNLVIGGNSWTAGVVSPQRWIEALRLPNGRPPRMDMYGQNPFSARSPDLKGNPLGNGYADFADLDTLAGWVDRNLGRKRRLKLFLSEYTLPTGHANFEFNFHVTERRQASWLRQALRESRAWSRIYSLGYLGLYDDPLRPDGLQVERGLLRRDGSAKPAYAAFRDG